MISYLCAQSLQLSADGVLSGGHVPANAEHIWLAANLAVFNVTLARACRRIDLRLIPFTTARALEARKHELIVNER